MKKISKILSVILAIMMVVSAMPITVNAAEASGEHVHVKKIVPEFAPTETTPGLTASVKCSLCNEILVEQQVIPALGTTDDASVIVSGTCGTNATWTYNTETGALIISGTGAISNYKSSQTRPWEGYKNNIKSIVIGDGITKLGNYAFIDCTSLIYVSIPDSVTTVMGYVFKGCNKLLSVTIPDTVTSIGAEAFRYCTNLVYASIGNKVTTINNAAFEDCTSLFNITIPDSVYYIYTSVFENCTSLKSISLGKNLELIENNAFNSCTSLTDVYYIGTEEDWGKISIGTNNAPLESATIHYGSVIGDDGETHKHEYIVVTVAPTCTEPGYLKFTCDCGDTYTENYVAFGHTKVVKPATAPTTTEEGNTYDERCLTCGEVFTEGQIIPVLNETSFTTSSGDNLISVLDRSTDTLTIYGTGTIEYGHKLNSFYYEPLNQNVHFNVDTLIITEGITGIGDEAFIYSSCETIIIADSVTRIGNKAFYENERVESVFVGDGVKTIGNSAFANCYYLNEFIIGKSVETIGKDAFLYCENLEGFIVDNENPYLSVDNNGILYNGDKTELILCPQGSKVTSYEMPLSVKEIRAGAFFKCPYIAYVRICDGVTAIPYEAFYRCENLNLVVIPASVTTVGESAFDYWCSLSVVYYGGTEEQWNAITVEADNESLVGAKLLFNFKDYESASGTCGEKLTWNYDADTSTLTISGTGEMTDFGYESDFPWYNYRKDIKKVIINDGVTSISNNAFCGFSSLTSVEIADSVITIGQLVFGNCDSLKSITLPDSVTSIGYGIFIDCIKLSNVKLSNGLTAISNAAFSGCINLINITIPDNIEIIGGLAFSGCKSLENITLSKNLTGIYAGTFAECYSLKAIDIPDSVTIICQYAFDYCIELETVKIGKGVKTIQERAFYNCNVLNNVYYAGGEHDWNLINIGNFNGCLLNNNIKFAEASGHSYDSVITDPTCTEQGYTTYTCECGDSYIDDYVDATGHQLGEWKISVNPTCTKAGEILKECSNCDHKEYDTVSALGHNYEVTITSPTCTEQGYTTYTCKCGYSYIDNYVDSLGHDMTIYEAIAPDCINAGLTEGSHCSRCDATTEQEIIPALGHSHDAVITSPTCTEQGYTTYTCECGDSYIDDYVDATGHNYEAVITPPTCTEQGYTTYTCECGDSYFDDYTDVIAHNYVDDICTGCGDIILNGWICEDGKWAYYVNNEKLTNKWIQDSVDWCYLGEDGYCVTNTWKADSKGWCYIGADSRIVRNKWLNDNGKWYFIDANGYMVSNKWMKDSVGWVYLGSSGAMLTNAWAKDSIGWCYVGADGYCVKSQWIEYNNNWYYIDANGYMVTGTVKIGPVTHKFASNGVWIG